LSSVAPIRFRVTPLYPHAHLFEVRCTVEDPDPVGQRFRLPVWIPGGYLIREFACHFVAVRAEADGRAVAASKQARDVWVAAPCTQPVTVVALVQAYDLSVRSAYLDATRAHFNGSAVFPCPKGGRTAGATSRLSRRRWHRPLPARGDDAVAWRNFDGRLGQLPHGELR